MAHSYGVLSELVRDAHERAGVKMTTLEWTGSEIQEVNSDHLGGRLPCMVATEADRREVLKLSSGEFIDIRMEPIRATPENVAIAKERYQLDEKSTADPKKELFGQAELFMSIARRVIVADKHHGTFFYLENRVGDVELATMRPDDRQESMLFTRELAFDVLRKGICSILMISEVWTAPFDPNKPRQIAQESAQRGEAVIVAAAHQDGRQKTLISTFTRKSEDIVLGDVVETEEIPALLSPVLDAWKRMGEMKKPKS